MSSGPESTRARAPQRSSGRRRVESLLLAAGEVFAERGFAAATMAEVASRAAANIGSLYRFFPDKEALADAIIERDLAKASRAYDQAEEQASVISTNALADLLLEMMADLHHETRALSALMEGDAQAGNRLVRTRAWAVGRIKHVLLAHCPKAGDRVPLEDIAILLLNGMKLMAAMTVEGTAPSSAGAVEELRAMFRCYLTERLDREGTVTRLPRSGDNLGQANPDKPNPARRRGPARPSAQAPEK